MSYITKDQVYAQALERATTLTPESYEQYYLEHSEQGLVWDDSCVVIEETNEQKEQC